MGSDDVLEIFGLLEIGVNPRHKRRQLYRKVQGITLSDNHPNKLPWNVVRILAYFNGVSPHRILKESPYVPDISIHCPRLPEDFYLKLSEDKKKEILKFSDSNSRDEYTELLTTGEGDYEKLFDTSLNSSNGTLIGKLVEIALSEEIRICAQACGLAYSPNMIIPHLNSRDEIQPSEVDGYMVGFYFSQYIELASRLRQRPHLIVKDKWT